MKTIVTGTVGLDKGPFLDKVARCATQMGHDLTVFHVGSRMYAEAPDVTPGRILDVPISRLSTLRRSVIKDLITQAKTTENIVVNTHATFRWKHGLFPAFDFDQLRQFDADLYVCLMDSVDAVHARLEAEHSINHSLKDLLVWREEETLATEMMMLGCRGFGGSADDASSRPDSKPPARFFALAVGKDNATAHTLAQLMFQPTTPKVYLSFPMTHVAAMPSVLAEIDTFRRCISQHFVVFDPADLEEMDLYQDALKASQSGQKYMDKVVLGRSMRFDVAEILLVAGDIHGQIYARDFMLIDQADMIISFVPELPDGKPALSSGVERELQHAHEAAKEVYVVWRPKSTPSPFVTETANKVFPDIDTALTYFESHNYTKARPHCPSSQSTLFPVW
ncbi:MAG: AAA family ATPase [Sedimentisphaerales bacterium]|nr:AAA family ATPase [Sedimentisphaerales bacterium]